MSLFGVILVRIFRYSDWIQRDILSVFSPNWGKCDQGNLASKILNQVFEIKELKELRNLRTTQFL